MKRSRVTHYLARALRVKNQDAQGDVANSEAGHDGKGRDALSPPLTLSRPSDGDGSREQHAGVAANDGSEKRPVVDDPGPGVVVHETDGAPGTPRRTHPSDVVSAAADADVVPDLVWLRQASLSNAYTHGKRLDRGDAWKLASEAELRTFHAGAGRDLQYANDDWKVTIAFLGAVGAALTFVLRSVAGVAAADITAILSLAVVVGAWVGFRLVRLSRAQTALRLASMWLAARGIDSSN